jgi:cytochrome c biogenesis protein CcdA
MTAGETLTVLSLCLAIVLGMGLAVVLAYALVHRAVVDFRWWRMRRRLLRLRARSRRREYDVTMNGDI